MLTIGPLQGRRGGGGVGSGGGVGGVGAGASDCGALATNQVEGLGFRV